MQPCCNIRCRRQDGGNDRMFNGEGGTTNIQLTFERERENRFEPAARRATPAGRDTAVSLQPRCGADMPVVARHSPLQPLHSTAASEPSMQQLPAGGWMGALIHPQAGLAQPPAARRTKRGAAGPAEAEPPKQAAKSAGRPPSPPAFDRLSPGMVPNNTRERERERERE